MTSPYEERWQYADAMGFLAPQMQEPYADAFIADHVDLMHVTAAPPNLAATGVTVEAVTRFAETIEDQDSLMLADDKRSLEVALGLPYTTAVVMGLQHTPADLLEGDNFDQLYETGIRVLTPEYKAAGRYGSGYLERDGGLTSDGRQLLEAMAARESMILDLSHLNTRTAEEAMDHIERLGLPLPVMASHGGIREHYDGPADSVNNLRNLPLDTLRRLQEFKAVVGMYTLTFGLSETDDSVRPFIDQVQRADQELPGMVVVGSDGIYAERNLDEWRQTVDRLAGMIAVGTDMKPRFPDSPLELNGADRLPTIGNLLLASGMDAGAARQIAGQRLIDFFLRSL